MLAQYLVAAFLGQSDHSEDEPVTPKRQSADWRNGQEHGWTGCTGSSENKGVILSILLIHVGLLPESRHKPPFSVAFLLFVATEPCPNYYLDARSENVYPTPKMLAQHLVAAFLGQSDHSEDEPITPKRESADWRNG